MLVTKRSTYSRFQLLSEGLEEMRKCRDSILELQRKLVRESTNVSHGNFDLGYAMLLIVSVICLIGFQYVL